MSLATGETPLLDQDRTDEHAIRRVKLEGCLLGKSAKIGANVELIRCACEAGFEVAAGGSYVVLPRVLLTVLHAERCKNEKLEASDWTTGVGQGDLESGEDEM